MTMQVANVKKVLVSVGKVTDANNRVVFDNDGSYIENKSTKERTPLRKENGVYTMEIWVPAREEQPRTREKPCLDLVCAFSGKCGGKCRGFARLDDSLL